MTMLIERLWVRRLAAALACASLVWGPGLAQVHSDPEAARLLGTLRQSHPGTQFTEIAPTGMPGVYEVWMQGTVAYVAAANPRLFLFGRLFDTEAMRDLTAPKLAQRTGEPPPDAANAEAAPPIAFDQLPLADAITVRRGAGRRQLAVFSDPGCGYCKQLEVELATLDDVTIHTFLVPFQGERRPIGIWCAADRAEAWHRWMLQGDARGQQPDAACAHPIARNLALARALRVQGTPTLFWADGGRTDGFVDRGVLQARLAGTAPVPAAAAAPDVGERRP
jgi:thiol:disulfide interchange protein DsbC